MARGEQDWVTVTGGDWCQLSFRLSDVSYVASPRHSEKEYGHGMVGLKSQPYPLELGGNGTEELARLKALLGVTY